MEYKDIKKEEGLTLIEIAIILVIIGILLGIGAGMVGTLTKRAKVNETKETVSAAIDSVISYGATNNELPDTTTFPTVVRNPNDAWTKPLYYIYDNNLTDASIGGICGRKTTNLTLRICPDATCSTPTDTISNVAFIVLSGGGNYNNQTAGDQGVTSATTINVYDVDVDNIDNYTGDINRPEPYDDIVKWITIDELRIKAGCVGPQLRILNNELPYGFQGSAYNATVSADGGVPFSIGGRYRWCRQESTSTGLTFNPGTLDADCLGLTETLWGQRDNLGISGIPTETGSFSFTFFVRDNNDSIGPDDNIAQKTLVLTINPFVAPIPAPCLEYRVWNDTGEKFDFMVDGWCANNIANGTEITTPTRRLGPGETIDRYAFEPGLCPPPILEQLTYEEAVSADTNYDCCVNFTGTDRACP